MLVFLFLNEAGTGNPRNPTSSGYANPGAWFAASAKCAHAGAAEIAVHLAECALRHRDVATAGVMFQTAVFLNPAMDARMVTN